MELQKIHIQGFKSIYDDLTIDFQDVNGFWRINGPVGAGKTTIGEAILFGLFGDIKGKNLLSLISWGEKHGKIEVWCRSKGHQLYIRREINMYGTSPIYAEVDGEELVFTNKRNAQKQLEEEYYDVSRITLELLCIINLNNFKSLATLNAADSKLFLDQVFGFYVLTNYALKCKERRSILREQIANNQSNIYSIDKQIEKIKQLASIAHIEGDIKDTRNKLTELTKQHNLTADKLKVERNEIVIRLTKEQDELAKIKVLGAGLAKEIKFIEQGKCPTCGAPIDQSQLERKREERQVLLNSYNLIQEKVNAILKELTEFDNQVSADNRNYQNKYTELNSLIVKLQEQEKRSAIRIQEIDALNVQKQELNDQLTSLNVDDEQWNQLFDILSTDIRQKILLSFIPLLNNSIREYTTNFQLPFIIEFDDSFKCKLSLYGTDVDIPISSLSTGQLKVVDISIILGILKTIMSSVNFNVCLLDELISNMDAELRQIICRVLKENIKGNQTIFIISHTELDDKYFDGAINVDLEPIDSIYKKSLYSIQKLH